MRKTMCVSLKKALNREAGTVFAECLCCGQWERVGDKWVRPPVGKYT